MLRACIDIGSNTARLLVAECDGTRLREVHQQRAFTHIGQALSASGELSGEKIAEVAKLVSEQLSAAHSLGAVAVRAVGTAAIRRAANGDALVTAIREQCGLEVQVLSGEQEARLAFAGAAQTLDHLPTGELGVVDVGGGSSELVVGQAPDRVAWIASVAIGSGELSSSFLCSDPPTRDELAQARARVEQAFAEVVPPHPTEAVAVGGSAASLARLAGPLLDTGTFKRSLTLLCNVRASDVARRFALDIERVRLLAGGLLILQAASERFGSALVIGRGGLREGVLLEAAHA